MNKNKFIVVLLVIVLFVQKSFAENVYIKQNGFANSYINLNKYMVWLPKDREDGDLHVSFRKSFLLKEKPLKATITLFAYTRYVLYINGIYVCRGPSRFENMRPEFDKIPVSTYLHKGSNSIAIMVHRDMSTGRIMSHAPGLSAQLKAVASGFDCILNTDNSWKAANNVSYGSEKKTWASISENIDSRLFDPHWITPDFDDSDWGNAKKINIENLKDWPIIYPRTIPLLKETVIDPINEQINPSTLSAGDSLILKFPRILQAYPQLSFISSAGTQFEIKFLLPDNSYSGINTYTSESGNQTYIGGDTYAFNKIKISVKSGDITFNKQQAVEVLYPFNQVGSFTCSDTSLNKIWSICAGTLKLLSEDAYVDCADRERVEWMDGDPPAFDCTKVMMSGQDNDGRIIWSDARLLKDMLRRVALTQRDDGMMKAHTCSERWDKHAIMEDRACDWVNGLRKYYESTGDKKFIRELWPALQGLLNWFTKHTTANGLVEAREWTVWDNPLIYQVCEGAALNAFVFSAYTDAAYLGNEIEEFRQSKKYGSNAALLAKNYNHLLWDEKDGSYYGGHFNTPVVNAKINNGFWEPTLTAAIFALDKNIIPKNNQPKVFDWVFKNLDQSHAPMSQYVLYKLLYQFNSIEKDNLILDLIRNNWQPMINSPWQTTWEDFKKGSKIHIYGILPAYYLSSYVLGVRLKGPASNKILSINPRLGQLSHAEGTVVTEFGPVLVKWDKSNGKLNFKFKIPKGTKAEVSLPFENKQIKLNGHKVNLPFGKPMVLLPGFYSGYFI